MLALATTGFHIFHLSYMTIRSYPAGFQAKLFDVTQGGGA